MERTRNLPQFNDLLAKINFVETLRSNENAPPSVVSAALDDAAQLCVRPFHS